ncbi:CDP-glycerol glycerophosphotransferase family protein [Thalassotalea profundi]|uniref:Teichoic acid biosynthesis protein n=1 Tax=Thalassotalea profundi TaxID=2036687 RepID=A0ABQ3ING0_9GAMM|nr:CDP-glycerol glycerophosphotransferase family protein [Thalassotalea profundi]GHE89447.1 teichoic acid biosynthesis protein [Thalassotalea profundi]
MKKLKKLVFLLINLILFWFSQLIPKNKNLWVFGAWFGQKYSDNPKAFFEYINQQQTHIHAIWISKDSRVVEHVRSLGFNAYEEKSILGIWYQLRAGYVFVCQSLHDDVYAPCIGKNTKVVNLWHGLPLKKIMYDTFDTKSIQKNIIGKLFDVLSPYEKHRNDYLLATSAETQMTLSKAFRIPKSRTIITGFPRNDVFLKPLIKSKSATYKCIYMPTFRGGIGAECDLFAQYGFDVPLIDAKLKANNVELVLRMHPVNKPPVYLIEKIKKSNNITLDSSADIFDSIADYDCMITDYSGGYFDFLLSGRPILFAPFDLEKYKQEERDLYYHYEKVTLKPYAYTWMELVENIITVSQNQFPEEYQESYKALQRLFHEPIGGNAKSFSGNLYEKLMRL